MVVFLNWRQRVMAEELIEGREVASELRRLLDTMSLSNIYFGAESAAALVTKILGSFTNTLSILNGIHNNIESDHDEDQLIISQIQPNNITTATATADLSSWDAHLDTAIRNTTSTFKDRRGLHKRRKTPHSWSRDSSTWTDDSHAWRKYGQKKIHNTNHPRNYFRCTHKFDQGCQATKHVQKIQDDPVPLFRTTSYGNHTCRDLLKAPHELLLDTRSPSRESSATYIRFDTTTTTSLMTNQQDHEQEQQHPFSSSIKKGFMFKEEEIIPSDHHDHMAAHSQSSPWHDYDFLIAPHDLTAFELPSSIALEHGDVFSQIVIDGVLLF